MDMRCVVKHFPNGEADVRAIVAGNDLLELSQNSARAIDLVLQAIKQGRLTQQYIDARVKKILATKYWLAFNNRQPIQLTNLYHALNPHDRKTTHMNSPP